MKMSILMFMAGICFISIACGPGNETNNVTSVTSRDSLDREEIEKVAEEPKEILPRDIRIVKEFLYDKYTLEDVYPYNDTTRMFQWDKIKEHLAMINTAQLKSSKWGILQNRRNANGEAPVAKNATRNKYNRVVDAYGVEKHQSVPLYSANDPDTPERYGRDGTWVRIEERAGSDSTFTKISTIYFEGEWMVPTKYLQPIEASQITKVVVVDRTNQNIATLENDGNNWLVRSMNKATTGANNSPYQQPTPLGIFVVQEKKDKMFYLVDGTDRIAGFAPYASRFSNGGYVHGIPVNNPNGAIVELSPNLGTIPRSHMCVRTASSHAKFIYDWAPIGEAFVVVIE